MIETHRSSHEAVDAFLQAFRKDPAFKSRFDGKDSLRRDVERLASEVERLAPAVGRETHPQNCEYPWSDGVRLRVPSELKLLDTWKSFAPNTFSNLVEILELVAAKV